MTRPSDSDGSNTSALSPSETRAATLRAEPVPVSGIAGIANAGDLIIISHPYACNRHVVAMVVKPGTSMWTVRYRDRYSGDGFGRERKRKVGAWLPAPAASPSDIDEFLQQAADELRVAERKAQEAYDQKIVAFAQGTPTRQRQDRNGLGPKDGGPVHESGCAQDAPEGPHHG